MPAKGTYSTVLVTGANSFYAAAIMDMLVQRNVTIHAAVRSQTSAQPLRDRYGGSIRVFIVPDISVRDAFYEPVKGCDAVIHVASPFRHNFQDAKTDMLDPAIHGALSALAAASSEPNVSRVVFTSSIAACIDPTHPDGFKRPGYTYTESDWNPLTYSKASTMTAFPPVYTASKALAEKAAWEFMEEQKPHFDLVCINPCHTWGAYSQHLSSPAAMNFTNSDLSKLMDGEHSELPPLIMPWMTDIDEVAQAHVKALYKPEASGRYIVANAPYDFQQVVDIMYREFPGADWIKNVPKGHPGRTSTEGTFILDNTRSREQLDVQYRPWEQSVIDFCRRYGEDRKRFL